MITRLRPGSTDLALGIVFLLVSVIAPFVEESHRQFWQFAPLIFGLPLLVSGALLLVVKRRAATIAARLIHYLLLVICAHLILLSALWMFNPFMWGAALLMPWPALIVALNSVGTLQWTAQNNGEQIRSCLVPVVASIIAMPLMLGGFLIWFLIGWTYRQGLYEKSALAAQVRAGRWQLVMTDPTTGALHRWQDGPGSSSPLPSLEHDPEIERHGFDVANGRIAQLENERPTVRDITSGAVVWQGGRESEEFRCIRFDQTGALLFVTVDSLVRLSPGDSRIDEGRLPHAPSEGCCPSISRDGSLIVWREGEKKPFVVLARRDGNARTEIARWPARGFAFLAPDGRNILVFDRLAVLRIDVATRRVSPLAQLVPRPRQKSDDQSVTPGVPVTHWPQTFSPNGKWFLISSSEADPCDRIFSALDVESGKVVELPVSLPIASCNHESFGWVRPNVIRWCTGEIHAHSP